MDLFPPLAADPVIIIQNPFQEAPAAISHVVGHGDSRHVRIPGSEGGGDGTPPGPAPSKMKHLPLAIAAVVCALTFIPQRPAVTGPVADALRSASSSDRARVASVYRALADVTGRDAGQQITSLAVWRSIHASSLRLAAGGTSLVGKHPGLDVAVDKVLRDAIGSAEKIDNEAMSGELVEKLVAGCKEVVRQSE